MKYTVEHIHVEHSGTCKVIVEHVTLLRKSTETYKYGLKFIKNVWLNRHMDIPMLDVGWDINMDICHITKRMSDAQNVTMMTLTLRDKVL
jgi:hypothetical protein